MADNLIARTNIWAALTSGNESRVAKVSVDSFGWVRVQTATEMPDPNYFGGTVMSRKDLPSLDFVLEEGENLYVRAVRGAVRLNVETHLSDGGSSASSTKTLGILTLEDFGAGDNGENADAALVSAVQNAVDGQVIRFSPGKSYTFESAHEFVLSDKSLTFEMTGARLVFTGSEDGLHFRAGWSAIADVVTPFADTGEEITLVQPLEGSNFRPKDMVRLISEDAPHDVFGSNKREALDAYVESISAGVFKFQFKSEIWNPKRNFSTGVRVAQRSGTSIHIKGGDISHASDVGSPPAYTNKRLLLIDGFTNPLVENLDCSFGVQPTLEFRACLGARLVGGFFGPKEDFQVAGEDPNIYGYGAIDNSFNTTMVGLRGRRQRHLTDTVHFSSTDTTDPSMYGSSVNLMVKSSISEGSSNDSFATHHGAMGTVLEDCVAVDSAKAGYGIRGETHVVNCRSVRCREDIYFFDQEDRNPARGSLSVRNHKASDCGPIRNSGKGVQVNFFDYQALNCINDPTLFITQDADCSTYFHGHTLVSLSTNYRNDGSAIFGNVLSGQIFFDSMDWDISGPFSRDGDAGASKPRLFTCREFGSGSNDYSLVGRSIRFRGAGPRAFLHGSSSLFPNPNQLRFAAVFDDGVIRYTGGDQNNNTAIQASFSNVREYLSSVLILTDTEASLGTLCKRETVSVSGPASVMSGAVEKFSIGVSGINPLAKYKVQGEGLLGALVIGGTATAADTLELSVLNTSATISDWSSLDLNLEVSLG